MKVLVIGSNGQVGMSLRYVLDNSGYDIFFSTKKDINISDLEMTRNEILKLSPNVIINASAYTNVDMAESQKQRANLINNVAVENLANISFERNIFLIHISTDYVFDGCSYNPYYEDDKTNPINVYGKTKLDGENSIIRSGCNYLILRTSSVFSIFGDNFLKKIIKLGQEREKIDIIDNQFSSPTFSNDIALTIKKLLQIIKQKKISSDILNYTGNFQCSWYEFTNVIFDETKKIGCEIKSKLHPICHSEFQTKTKRPSYSVLNCSKIKNLYNIDRSDTREGIKSTLKELLPIND